ncbi:MAG: hypothetical protein KatS3mg035_0275 [Bacteroidia bacterium]|nr:MAG: hypothetical protein KatS3mg035_0275 [Bacteroidia bacterium]
METSFLEIEARAYKFPRMEGATWTQKTTGWISDIELAADAQIFTPLNI